MNFTKAVRHLGQSPSGNSLQTVFYSMTLAENRDSNRELTQHSTDSLTRSPAVSVLGGDIMPWELH